MRRPVLAVTHSPYRVAEAEVFEPSDDGISDSRLNGPSPGVRTHAARTAPVGDLIESVELWVDGITLHLSLPLDVDGNEF